MLVIPNESDGQISSDNAHNMDKCPVVPVPLRGAKPSRGGKKRKRRTMRKEEGKRGGGTHTHKHDQKEMSEKIDGEDQREEEDMER